MRSALIPTAWNSVIPRYWEEWQLISKDPYGRGLTGERLLGKEGVLRKRGVNGREGVNRRNVLSRDRGLEG